jgi:hypothetical protein
LNFHHIGIFVKSLDFGYSQMSKFINIGSTSQKIEDEVIGVEIIFLKDTHNITYELVSPYGDNSPVKGVFARGKDFLNHIAYTTNQFDYEIKRLRTEGMIPLGPAKKAKAFKGARVIFFLTTLGFIIELVENKLEII